MAKNWEHAAGVVWDILVELALEKKTISYSQIAPQIKTNPLSVGRALGPIQDYCIEEKLPPLTSIVIGKNSQKPGGGFIAWDIDDFPKAQQIVFAYNWRVLPNPYKNFEFEDTTDSLAQKILNNPSRSGEIYTKVKVRGLAQKIFRLALLEAYDSKCCFCGFSFPEALEASHILPWSNCEKNDRINPENGILLCSTHHKLFDTGIMTIDDSYIIHIKREKVTNNNSKYDKLMFDNLDGEKIKLPKNICKPNIKYIKARNKINN